MGEPRRGSPDSEPLLGLEVCIAQGDISPSLGRSSYGILVSMTVATASGKVILLGEHAVVYRQPAIAVPVAQVRAKATVEPNSEGITILAKDLGLCYLLGTSLSDKRLEPLVMLVEATMKRLGVQKPPHMMIAIESEIPMARGLGSGAAVGTALVRALSEHLGHALGPGEVSSLVYEAERFYHGTPSGIDNTVIAYEHPIFFLRDEPPCSLKVGKRVLLAIGDSGIPSPTKEVVGEVRRAWEREPEKYETIFHAIGNLARRARRALEGGGLKALGEAMNRNQELLGNLGVSLPQLDRLVEEARNAGALGAKLSGAGKGGTVIALVDGGSKEAVVRAWEHAGAQKVILAEVG